MSKIVLYVGRFELPYGTAAAQRVKVNKKAIEKAGYEVKFISTFENDRDFESIGTNININGINKKKFLYDISYIKKALKTYGEENIHAVIFYNFPSVALLRFNKYFKKKDIKVLADCTEWYDLQKNSKFIQRITKFLDTEFRMRFVHKKTEGLICISSYLEKYYHSKKIKTILVPNLLDLQEDKWQKNNDFQERNSNHIKMVYAGNPGQNFDKESLDVIVEAFVEMSNTFPNLKLEVLGISKEEFLEKYFLKYKKEIQPVNILFHGRQAHLKVIKTVQESDYFIFFRPKTRANIAGFPTKLVEAFGAITPSITNDIGDVKKYVKSGINGYLFNTANPLILKEDLKSLIQNHQGVSLFKEELRRDNPFDYNHYVNKFKEILE